MRILMYIPIIGIFTKQFKAIPEESEKKGNIYLYHALSFTYISVGIIFILMKVL